MKTQTVAAEQMPDQVTAQASRLSVAVVANRNAGGLDDDRIVPFRVALQSHGGPELASFAAVAPDEMDVAVDEALARGCDALLIAGGDGSFRGAAEKAHAAGVPAAPLPFGTMNVLARALFGEASPEEIFHRLGEARRIRLPTGSANGRMFFLTVAAGFPVEAMKARESVRSGDILPIGEIISHAAAAVEGAAHADIMLQIEDGEPTKVSGVAVAVGAGEELLGFDASTEEKMRGVVLDPNGLMDLARLTGAAINADVANDPSSHEFLSKRVELHCDGVAQIALDGEPLTMRTPVEILKLEEGVRSFSLLERS